jgi:predicted nucleotidyltransferase
MDLKDLLKSLNAHEVRYVIIGATAFPVHGYVRATLDVDILIEPTEENARRTWDALHEFGYDLADLTVEDMLTKKILIRQYWLETDIHPSAAGVTFEQVWTNCVEGVIGETSTRFAGLDELIAMKQAAGRPKDLEDLRVLLKLRERQESTTHNN